jgi:phytoene dehydrogenase-like protein
MAAAAKDAGVDIEVGTPVDKILLKQGKAVGVKTRTGEELSAPCVVSNVDPRTTFLNFVGPQNLEAEFAHRVGHYRTKGRTAKVNLVLSDLPTFDGLEPDDLRERLVIAPSRRYLELAFNPTKYGQIPEAPALEVILPSMRDPDLTEGGQHVLSAIVQHVPYDADDEAAAEKLLNSVLGVLEVYAKDIRSLISSQQVLLPKDIEERFGVSGGHWHHGEMAIDQMFMMRPLHGSSRYRTPIDNLYLCGAGTHPGGNVFGAAGHNAAHSILEGRS